MANYSKDNFIAPVNINTYLNIRDINNKNRYTIYHNNATVFSTKSNTIQIKTNSESNIIVLDFSTDIEAKQAVTRLRTSYIEVKTNYDNQQKIDINIEENIYSSDYNNLIDGQNQLYLEYATKIFLVSINGVNISDYIFDTLTKILTIDTNILGYDIEDSDIIKIKYFI